ncbi:MAG: hypothetical protein LBV69_06350 [Bacteroidales bacterium]|jgi:hypothetical protein|nr:hypothetical protein [Bacteroidales bacterium]
MKSKIIIFLGFIIIYTNTFSQNNNGEKLDEQVVIIYNEYSPVLKDANRIQILPTIVDTVKIQNKFDYNMLPTLFKTTFTPPPIGVATLKGETLKPIDNGMIKLGYGNYVTPYIEAFYNNKRNADYDFGAYIKHHSSHGKTNNSEKQKIYNGFANTILDVYGKKFLPSSTLSADLGFTSNIINYYGYDPNYVVNLVGITAPRDRNEMEDFNIMRLKANIDLSSNKTTKNRFDYNINFGYKYLFTNLNEETENKNRQNKIDLKANLNKTIKIHRFGLDAGMRFSQMSIDTLNSNKQMFLDINPYYKIYAKSLQVTLGVNMTEDFQLSDTVKKFHIYPNLFIQHNIGNIFIVYAGFKGYMERNDLDNIAYKNQFINVFNNYQNTNFAQVIELGFKGYPTKFLYFNIAGNYSKIDNMPYFVNDTSLTLQNKFLIEYANTERFSGYAEIALRDFYKFTVSLSAHYYYYHYVRQEYENQFLKPWHCPNFDLSLITSYQFNEKLNFGINFQFIGKRYARDYKLITAVDEYGIPILDPNGNEMQSLVIEANKLKPIVDISLFGEYQIFHNLSAFLYLNNITAQKQYLWNNYQSVGFNFLIGAKYVF